METSIISLRLAWLTRIYSRGRIPWKAFLDYLLEDYGGTFFVSCNYNMRDYNINSLFYSELLQWWDDFRNAFSTLPLTAENIIWNNKLIKIDGKSIYYHNYVKAGILLTNQMQFDKGSLESYNIATNAGLKQSNLPALQHPEWSLSNLLSSGRAMELANKRAADIKQPLEALSVNRIHAKQMHEHSNNPRNGHWTRTQTGKTCYFCGDKYPHTSHCPAKSK